ncbi:MAG TPA: hypothetical protein VFK05_20385, partial [Polyangiaceae bacterium]|nr:hypothetical protein [Polyangiaceae bacterium]
MNEMASFKARLRLAALLSATVVIGFAFPGCVTTVSIECANGLICPSGSRCDDTNHRCVTDPEQSPCIDHVDGDACKLFSADGACHAGVCVVLFCGDGIVNGTEDCDGAPPAGQTCLDLGFDRGLLGCSERCKTVTDQCARFGWKALPPATMDVLDGVWANHWDDVYVASRGEKVAVLHWDGSAWSQMAGSQMTWETGSPQIWGSSSNDLFFTVGG